MEKILTVDEILELITPDGNITRNLMKCEKNDKVHSGNLAKYAGALSIGILSGEVINKAWNGIPDDYKKITYIIPVVISLIVASLFKISWKYVLITTLSSFGYISLRNPKFLTHIRKNIIASIK